MEKYYEIHLIFKNKEALLREGFYSVAIPVKTEKDALKAIKKGVSISMKEQGFSLVNLRARELDLNEYLKLAQ